MTKFKKTALFATVLVLIAFVGALTALVAGAVGTSDKGVIEVYLIAGQSNAVGYGKGEVSVEDERITEGFEDVLYYGVHQYSDNDDNLPPKEFTPVKLGLGRNTESCGAEIGIARAVSGNGKNSAVIKCAYGGTALNNVYISKSIECGTWTSPSYIEKNNMPTDNEYKIGRLYNLFLNTVANGIDMLKSEGYTPVIKGIWWMQGEAETSSSLYAAEYEAALTDLINDLRSDIGKIMDLNLSTLPFVMGEITRNPNTTQPKYIENVRQAQRNTAEKMTNVSIVKTEGLAQHDEWHYTAEAQRIIGEKFVEIVSSYGSDMYTPYGTIPQAYTDPDKYPIAVFSNGKYIKSCGTWGVADGENTSAMQEAIALLRMKATNAASVQFYFIDDVVSDGFSNTGYMGGHLTVDLNGHTLSSSESKNILDGMAKGTGNKMCDTSITFKNGNITSGKKCVTAFGVVTEKYYGPKTFYYVFDNINFSIQSGVQSDVALVSVSANHTSDTDASKTLNVDMEFNNCNFDLFTNKPEGKYAGILSGNDNNGNVSQTVRINGGSVKRPDNGSYYLFGSEDEITYGKHDGSYTKFILPVTKNNPPLIYFTSTDSNIEDNLRYVKLSEGQEFNEFILTEVKTKYGEIPETLWSVENNPYVIFKYNGDGTLAGVVGNKMLLSENTRTGAFATAKEWVSDNEWDSKTGYNGQKTAVLLQRRDYTATAKEVYYDFAFIRGEVTLDLGGYTLAQSAESGAYVLLRFHNRLAETDGMANGHADIFPTTINFINGKITTHSKPVMAYQVNGSSSVGNKIEDKKFTINYKEVSFAFSEGATVNTLMFAYSNNAGNKTDNDPDPKSSMFTNFIDCEFDISEVPSGNTYEIFGLYPTVARGINNTVTVIGGSIKANHLQGLANIHGSIRSGCSIRFNKSDRTGEYTALYLPRKEAYPAYTLELKNGNKTPLTFTHVDGNENIFKYVLGESELNDYGYLPHRFTDSEKWPFILYILNGNGKVIDIQGTSKLLGTDYSGAYVVAKEKISDNEWNADTGYQGQLSAVILQRRDYTLEASERNDNFAQTRGEIIYDLGGYTLSQITASSARPIFYITTKPWGTDGMADGHRDTFPTTFSYKNGTILTYNGPIFHFANAQSATEHSLEDKVYTFNFDGVTLGFAEGAVADSLIVMYDKKNSYDDMWIDNPPVVPYVFNFDDCVFDLTNAPTDKNVTLFDVTAKNKDAEQALYTTVQMNVVGGTVKAKTMANITFATDIGQNSSLNFNKNEEGSYTVVELTHGAEMPIVLVNDKTLGYIKVLEGEATDVYNLAPVEISEYTPKMSLTLDRNLIINVYVPVATFLDSFTLDGVEYTDLDKLKKVSVGEEVYYFVSIALDARSAARDVVLSANVNIGDKTATGTFTFGVIKYTEKILADGSDVEKTLVKDVLSYVRAAYAYFNTEDVETISKINAILGENYDDNNAPVIEGSANATTSGLKSATFSLDGTPAMRFYLADGADASKYAFFIDGTRVKTETSADGTYIDIDVYAYALCETVTYTIDGVDSGSFHIGAYYEWSKTQNNENLENLVARFWKYLQSARAYRDSVVEG